MRKEFAEELEKSGWIHRPLFINREDSIEEEIRREQVISRKPLWRGPADGEFAAGDQGSCRITEEKGTVCLSMEAALKTKCWPKGMPRDGDCAYYGNLSGVLKPSQKDWRSYSRLHFFVRPCCPGLHTVSLSVLLRNEGEENMPDKFQRTGQHMMNLENHVWNECIWEISSLPRDCITELEFRCRLAGSDTGFGETAVFAIRDIYLEKAKTRKDWGWDMEAGQISYDTCGYFPEEEKIALSDGTGERFQILDADSGAVVLEKEAERKEWKGNTYGLLDFSELQKKGRYKIRIQGTESREFAIGKGWAEEMLWKGVNFLFCQRCGYPVPGKHGCCHLDCYGVRGEQRIPYFGGWHDAGDMSQQTVQTAEITEELFLLARQNKKNTRLYERLMEEACWGLSFVLRTRFGDGCRAASLGLIRWTDGIQGNEDDAGNVRVYNHAIDNFICACAEAEAAAALKEYDPETAWAALEAAKQDYGFAVKRYEEYGFEQPIMWEHTYGASASLCYAVISKCAGLLYRASGDKAYARAAEKFAEKLVRCQEKEGKVKGYFYRDESHSHMVHFNHQAREHYFACALRQAAEICGTGEGEKGAFFKQSLELYGDYLETLLEYASPYGMLPAGLYREHEAEQEEIFTRMHLLSSYEDCRKDYKEQVRNGEKISGDLYVKQFPVWFSFRGNTNVQLSMAQAAFLTGGYLGRRNLLQAAAEQIHWLNGKNPFRQSLVTGNGKRFGTFYAVFPGICAGQIPVGIQTKKNEDIPFWPHGNQATYREVWTSCTIKMMTICGEWINL